MERTETPALRRKLPVNQNPRSCGRRASALLCIQVTPGRVAPYQTWLATIRGGPDLRSIT